MRLVYYEMIFLPSILIRIIQKVWDLFKLSLKNIDKDDIILKKGMIPWTL